MNACSDTVNRLRKNAVARTNSASAAFRMRRFHSDRTSGRAASNAPDPKRCASEYVAGSIAYTRSLQNVQGSRASIASGPPPRRLRLLAARQPDSAIACKEVFEAADE